MHLMYLHGSKWSMNRRRRRRNPWLLIVLVVLVAGAVYVDRVVVPVTPPLFVPTPTPTRSPGSFATDAENYFSQGKLDQAITAYKEALRSDPNNAAYYIALAKTQMFAGDYEGAKTNAENALLINPNNSTGNAVRGWALGYLEDYLPAEAALKQAIQIDPNNAIAHAFYAEMLAKK